MDTKIDKGSKTGKFEPSILESVYLALVEFLWIPALMITVSILVAGVTFRFDHNDPSWISAVRGFLGDYLFQEASTTHDFLGIMVGGLMTVVSITISMLLVVLQQSSTNHGTLVFDQFLNRRRNQIYLGYFAATVNYVVITFSLSGEDRNLIIGASFTLLLSIGTIILLMVLLFSTINQMRPEVIIGSVHTEALHARLRQLSFVKQTRRCSEQDMPVVKTIKSTGSGFVTHIRSEPYEDLPASFAGKFEIELLISYGSYVNLNHPIAHIRGTSRLTIEPIERAIYRSITLRRQRQTTYDPAYSILQLEMIGWTAASSAKHIPESAQLVINNLGDLIARWSHAKGEVSNPGPPLPVVYKDNLFDRVLDSLESLAVVSSESQQHMVYASVLETLAGLYDRLSTDLQRQSAHRINRMIPGLRRQMLTQDLESALQAAIAALHQAEYKTIASDIEKALDEKRREVGNLASANDQSK